MTSVKQVPWDQSSPPSEQEAEARLRQEGYQVFRWHDVPGSNLPRHRHVYDECVWVLQGSMTFGIEDSEYVLKAGDRLYLARGVPHTTRVPATEAVTFVVGQKS